MSHGGARPGAGRPKGALNRLTQEAREKAAEGGITPLEYMLDILRDEEKPADVRFEAAKAAAPYMHARLAAMEHSGPDGGPIQSEHAINMTGLDDSDLDQLERLREKASASSVTG